MAFVLSYLSLFMFLTLILLPENHTIFLDWSLIILSSSNLSISFIIDPKSLMFSSVVFIISASVMSYCLEYMFQEKFLLRFILILLLFILSMIILIFSSNLMMILLGWDGLGVSSYFLVIYFQNKLSLNSGMVTAMTNRLGDIGIIFMICLFSTYGSWNFLSFSLSNFNFSSLFLLLLFTTISTKSAQIPFSAWLPAAMAAPTPVSSLVHSSTLVTAGVFLLIRLSNFNHNKIILHWILFIGSMTMFMSLTSSVIEKDFKKIIALSTLSHLGFMVMLVGLNNPNSAFFHLIIHAFFKALLFLTVGVIIHSFKDYQSFYMISSSYTVSKLNSFILVISLFSLCGLPFMSGFYSKDLGIELLFNFNMNTLLFSFTLLMSMSSIIYSTRILKLTVFSSGKLLPVMWLEKNHFFFKNMITLALLSISSGNFVQIKIFNSMNFSFISTANKLIIPTLILLLFFMSWTFFSSEHLFSTPLFRFLISMMFMNKFSFDLPSLIVKTFSKNFIHSQNKWVEFHTTKTFSFWEKLFFLEKLLSLKLRFSIVIPIFFILTVILLL